MVTPKYYEREQLDAKQVVPGTIFDSMAWWSLLFSGIDVPVYTAL